MVRIRELRSTGERIYAEFSQKNVTFMAAGIAYNAFVSLVPLLVLLLVAISAVGGGLEDRLVDIARQSLPAPIADIVVEVFSGDTATPGASVVGLLVLVWGTLKIFRGLDTAFSEIYETTGENSFVDRLVDGLVVFVSMLVAILATVLVTAAFARFGDVIPLVGFVTPLVLVVGLVVAFVPMYVRFPDTDVTLKDALPGVVFAAVGWAVFQGLFQVYLQLSGGGPGGFFGGVIVVVIWLYFSGLVLLVGAVINSVLGGHSSGRAGGVGRGASDYETLREESMTRDEFAAYLTALRERVTGRYEGMRPSTDETGPEPGEDGWFPRSEGDVEVIEQYSIEGEHPRWEVAVRWRPAGEGSDGGARDGEE